MGVASPEGTSTRQIFPSYDVISARESGVNDEPGIKSRFDEDS